jgi:hypothetical protein
MESQRRTEGETTKLNSRLTTPKPEGGGQATLWPKEWLSLFQIFLYSIF